MRLRSMSLALALLSVNGVLAHNPPGRDKASTTISGNTDLAASK